MGSFKVIIHADVFGEPVSVEVNDSEVDADSSSDEADGN